MFNFILLVAVVYLIVQAFQFHVVAGIGAIIAVLAFGYFKWYTNFCVTKARVLYGKDPEKALEWFARGYKHGMNIGQQETYAYYLLREGETQRAEEIYNHLLSQNLKPELRLKLRSDLAVLYLKTGRIDEALEELEDVTVHYINTTTYGTLGYLYLLKDNRRKAEQYNKEAYAYNSEDPVILDNMVQLYIKMGRFDEAKKYGDKLIEKKPYFVEGYYDTAYVYMKLGDFEKAEEIFEMGKDCRITFMSTVKEDELARFKKALSEKDTTYSHKLGSFMTQAEEEVIEEDLDLEYLDEEEPIIEYEELPEEDIDENDPFI